MMEPLPVGAREIFVKWHRDECGIGVTAFTDQVGTPYIGLYPVDFDGIATGLPTYFERRRLMSNAIVGFLWCKPAVVFLDAEVTQRGLAVRLVIPATVAGKDLIRHLFQFWDGPSPEFPAFAANSNRPGQHC